MPTAKRLKSSGGRGGHHKAQAKDGGSEASRPVAPAGAAAALDTDGDGEFVQVARDNWLRTSSKAKIRVQPDVLKRDIWGVLERDGFAYKSLLALEGLQTLER